MLSIASKVSSRLAEGVRRFQPVLQSARLRDINEADTVTIVKDLLAYLWGFDKYSEVTSEHQIRGTYCDLAVEVEGRVVLLIEVKAIGLELKDAHVKQAVDYATNKGVDWVALTNGHHWHLYRVQFTKPIEAELVLQFDLLDVNSRKQGDIEDLYVLTREGMQRSALEDHYSRRQATDRFLLAAVIVGEPVLQVVRRELRRLNPDIKVELEQIRDALMVEVLKRDAVEGDKAADAAKRVSKAGHVALRARSRGDGGEAPCTDTPPETADAMPPDAEPAQPQQ